MLLKADEFYFSILHHLKIQATLVEIFLGTNEEKENRHFGLKVRAKNLLRPRKTKAWKVHINLSQCPPDFLIEWTL